jgi:hypothetical protein
VVAELQLWPGYRSRGKYHELLSKHTLAIYSHSTSWFDPRFGTADLRDAIDTPNLSPLQPVQGAVLLGGM